MPCDTVQVTTFVLQNADEKLVAKAMESLGLSRYDYTFNKVRGRIDVQGYNTITQAQINEAYALETTKYACEQTGMEYEEKVEGGKRVLYVTATGTVQSSGGGDYGGDYGGNY